MSLRSTPSRARIVAPILVALLVAPFGVSTARADDAPATSSGTDTPRELAEDALATVEDLVAAPATPAPATPTVPAAVEGRDLTVALRDLAVRQDDLGSADRRIAARLLARPTDRSSGGCDPYSCFSTIEEAPICGPRICVHYVAGTADRADPGFATEVSRRMEAIAQTYVDAGYRPTVADGAAGGDARFDVYLSDVGSRGLYGYCAPETPGYSHGTSSAYCVLDNDYATSQFGGSQTPIANLEVTAAHEFFHAVQFAYDFGEDGWIMEATATWAEEQLFSGVNDNRQYLSSGPLGKPNRSLDTWAGVAQYGAWIFPEYLGERFPAAQAGMPVIVRRIWEYLGSGQFSVQAISSVLAEQGTTLAYQFAKFTAWNRRPAQYYREGAAYREAPLAATYRLSASKPSRSGLFTLAQLSAKHYRFVPTMSGKWRLKLSVNLNSRSAGGYAIVTVKRKGQDATQRRIKLDRDGRGTLRLPFGTSRVSWVELDAVNASGRYTRCGSRGADPFSTCQGYQADDNTRNRFEVRAYRG